MARLRRGVVAACAALLLVAVVSESAPPLPRVGPPIAPAQDSSSHGVDDAVSSLVAPSYLPISYVRPRAIGRMSIRRMGLYTRVYEGVTLSVLRYGPGRYPESAKIGFRGTTAFAGHRTTYTRPFWDLQKLQRGDTIVISTSRTVYLYHVTRVVIVKPTATWVIRGDPRSHARWRLTLTACHPRFSARQRIVAWADLASSHPV